jgi:hypothetical protein
VSEFQIKLDAYGHGHVYRDGKEVKDVVAVEVRGRTNAPPVVVLTLRADQVEVVAATTDVVVEAQP